MSWFFTKDRLKKITGLRIAYAVTFVLMFLSTEIGRKIYRPWVYQNHIDDYGIADTIGNSLGTLTQIFFYFALINATRIQSYRIIAFVTVGYILYEVVQPILPRGTFDWGDVYATLGAGMVAAIVVSVIHLFARDKKIL